MRSLVVLFGLLLTDAALAAACIQPSAPDVPASTPIGERAEKKLSREVARYVGASAKYISCLGADDSADPSTVAQRQAVAFREVAELIELYETRVGYSNNLIAEISQIAGRMSPSALDRRIATAQRLLASNAIAPRNREAIATLNVAIADINAGRYAEARAAIGELDFNSLSPFEHSQAERVLYTVSYSEEKFAEAREHVEKSINAGGLSAEESFKARLALVNLDVMLRLSGGDSERVADQPAE